MVCSQGTDAQRALWDCELALLYSHSRAMHSLAFLDLFFEERNVPNVGLPELFRRDGQKSVIVKATYSYDESTSIRYGITNKASVQIGVQDIERDHNASASQEAGTQASRTSHPWIIQSPYKHPVFVPLGQTAHHLYFSRQ